MLEKPLFSLTEEFTKLHQDILNGALLDVQNVQTPSNEFKSEYISLDKTSELYGIPKDTLYGYNSQRKLVTYKFGKQVFYKFKEIEKMIEESRRSSRSEMRSKPLLPMRKKK